MIFCKLAKKIELGPRQMEFGFEGQNTKNQNSVLLFIEKEYQADGPAALDGLISSKTQSEELSELEILQIIFWLAEELKIHFFAKDRIISPLQTKRMLIENSDNHVFVVTNKQVDRLKFEQSLKIARSILPALPEQVDQYTFSRHLVNKLKTWQATLKSYESQAGQPLFPGKKEIINSTLLLAKILEKQDSYSMIISFLKYKSRIVQLAEIVMVLTQFYTQALSFWQIFIDRMQAFETNLSEIRNNNNIFTKYCRLSEIFKSPYPYPLITEAESLLTDVQDFYQQVEQKKMETMRSKSFAETKKMIKKLISLFDTFESDQEYRNHSLSELRALSKRIENGNNIEEINTLYNDAKDLFVDLIEEM